MSRNQAHIYYCALPWILPQVSVPSYSLNTFSKEAAPAKLSLLHCILCTIRCTEVDFSSQLPHIPLHTWGFCDTLGAKNIDHAIRTTVYIRQVCTGKVRVSGKVCTPPFVEVFGSHLISYTPCRVYNTLWLERKNTVTYSYDSREGFFPKKMYEMVMCGWVVSQLSIIIQ